MGIVGSVRAFEVTHGRNGWHPHLHILWLFKDEVPQEKKGEALPLELLRIEDDKGSRVEWLFEHRGWLVERWREMVARNVGDCRANVKVRGRAVCTHDECQAAHVAPDLTFGVSVVPLRRHDYIAKLGLELGDPGTKEGRRKGRTQWQIASDIAEHRRARDVVLWHIYCSAMKGARQLMWSRGLKQRYGIDEVTDDEVVACDEERGPTDRTVGFIPANVWWVVRRDGPALAELLEQTESGGSAAFQATLRRVLSRARPAAAS
jgi:hypothetical protein